MGSGPSLPRDKHVVVVGAGYGGTALCMELQRMGISYTLISPRDYMHHNVAALRAVVAKGMYRDNVLVTIRNDGTVQSSCVTPFF